MRSPKIYHGRSPRPVAALDLDGPAMRDAIDALNEAGIRFTRQTEHHLKIGAWNYYPARGTLFRDTASHSVMRDIGLDALVDQIRASEHSQLGGQKKCFSNLPTQKRQQKHTPATRPLRTE